MNQQSPPAAATRAVVAARHVRHQDGRLRPGRGLRGNPALTLLAVANPATPVRKTFSR
jgi:hypothetical protein